MLKEEHLKLDRVLDSMAIIFHRGCRLSRKFVDQTSVRDRSAVRCVERFAGEAESIRLSVVGSAENHECSLSMLGTKRVICVAVGLPPTEGTNMRRRDADDLLVRLHGFRTSKVLIESSSYLFCLVRIGGAGMAGET